MPRTAPNVRTDYRLHLSAAVDRKPFEHFRHVTFPALPESEVVRRRFSEGSDGLSEGTYGGHGSCNAGSDHNEDSVAAGGDRDRGFAIRIGHGLIAHWGAEVHRRSKCMPKQILCAFRIAVCRTHNSSGDATGTNIHRSEPRGGWNWEAVH